MDIPEEQFKLCKEANRQFCPLLTPLQPLTNPPSCVTALYTKNSREIDCLCELTTKAQPEIYLPIPLTPNVWAIISSSFRQQPPVTVICPTKPAASINISLPIHVLKLEPACSATSQHFHLPPKYEDTHVTINFSIYNANLDVIDTHQHHSESPNTYHQCNNTKCLKSSQHYHQYLSRGSPWN